MIATIHEGRYLRSVCCLECRAEVEAVLRMATPVSFYVGCWECRECSTELVAFDMEELVAA